MLQRTVGLVSTFAIVAARLSQPGTSTRSDLQLQGDAGRLLQQVLPILLKDGGTLDDLGHVHLRGPSDLLPGLPQTNHERHRMNGLIVMLTGVRIHSFPGYKI